MHESGELETFFTERALAERDKLRTEGRAEGRAEGIERGLEQGIAAERDLLRRLATRKSMRARRSGWQACCRGSTIPRVSPRRETGSSSAPAATS